MHNSAAMQVHARQSTPIVEPTSYRSKLNPALGIEAQGFCGIGRPTP